MLDLYLEIEDATYTNCQIGKWYIGSILKSSHTRINELKEIAENLYFQNKIVLISIHHKHHFYLLVADIKKKNLTIVNAAKNYN